MGRMKNTVVCLGELLIDFVPETNGLALSDVAGFRRTAGGAPANVAATVSKLGGVSRFIGKVGADPFGDYLRERLADAGVDVTQSLLRTVEAQTGLAFVSLKADGERDFLFYRSPAADMLLAPEEIDEGWLGDAAVFHFGSVSLIAEPAREATETAAKAARAGGTIVSYDPNVRLPLWPSPEEARAAIVARVELADLVKLSEEEALFLTGESDAAAGAHALLDLGPKAVVVTLGAEGCQLFTAAGSVTVPGYRIETVDTTGAGDGFAGGLLYRLARLGVTPDTLGERLSDASFAQDVLGFANAVGALATTKRGAIPSLPTLSEAEALIASRRKL